MCYIHFRTSSREERNLMFKISFHGYFTFILDFITGKHFFVFPEYKTVLKKVYTLSVLKNAFDSRAKRLAMGAMTDSY